MDALKTTPPMNGKTPLLYCETCLSIIKEDKKMEEKIISIAIDLVGE